MLPRDRPETHSAHILSDNQFHEHLYLVPLVHENISLFSVVIASIWSQPSMYMVEFTNHEDKQTP